MNGACALDSVLFIVGQRHGNAAKAAMDLDRPLSDKGERQREAAFPAIEAFGPFDLVLSSPALRAQQTVARLSTYLTLPELYFPAEGSEDRLILDAVYDRLGNTPLRMQLASEAGSAYSRWVAPARERVLEAIVQYQAKRVLIGGHGLFTQMLMFELALLLNAESETALYSTLAEADALMICRHASSYLSCPKIG